LDLRHAFELCIAPCLTLKTWLVMEDMALHQEIETYWPQ
jgi:hypothetical protein